MSVIICGTAKGTEEEPYRCICCQKTFADIEQLAVSICWDCQTGSFDCEICLDRGVPFDQFSDRSDDCEMHKFANWENKPDVEDYWEHDDCLAVAVCGFKISVADLGQGVAVIFKYCQSCWPERDKEKDCLTEPGTHQ